MMVDLHGGPNSAISRVPVGDTSYAHRNALLKYQFMDQSFGTYPSNGFDFMNGWVATITDTMKNTAYAPFGMYINYADPSLSPDEAHTHYVSARVYVYFVHSGTSQYINPLINVAFRNANISVFSG